VVLAQSTQLKVASPKLASELRNSLLEARNPVATAESAGPDKKCRPRISFKTVEDLRRDLARECGEAVPEQERDSLSPAQVVKRRIKEARSNRARGEPEAGTGRDTCCTRSASEEEAPASQMSPNVEISTAKEVSQLCSEPGAKLSDVKVSPPHWKVSSWKKREEDFLPPDVETTCSSVINLGVVGINHLEMSTPGPTALHSSCSMIENQSDAGQKGGVVYHAEFRKHDCLDDMDQSCHPAPDAFGTADGDTSRIYPENAAVTLSPHFQYEESRPVANRDGGGGGNDEGDDRAHYGAWTPTPCGTPGGQKVHQQHGAIRAHEQNEPICTKEVESTSKGGVPGSDTDLSTDDIWVVRSPAAINLVNNKASHAAAVTAVGQQLQQEGGVNTTTAPLQTHPAQKSAHHAEKEATTVHANNNYDEYDDHETGKIREEDGHNNNNNEEDDEDTPENSSSKSGQYTLENSLARTEDEAGRCWSGTEDGPRSSRTASPLTSPEEDEQADIRQGYSCICSQENLAFLIYTVKKG
jgi:hypothetical protein